VRAFALVRESTIVVCIVPRVAAASLLARVCMCCVRVIVTRSHTLCVLLSVWPDCVSIALDSWCQWWFSFVIIHVHAEGGTIALSVSVC
jgi:hypothetical protein